MRNLIAAVYFLLSMFGWDIGGTTIVHRSAVDGIEQIHSRIRTASVVTRFECLASASGECHYTLFPRPCASAANNCQPLPAERITMAAGATREVVGLADFSACVAQDDTALSADCKPRAGAK
ncbi:hypothetical protein [Lysobacter solisilvae (ex Woo and Kim 2020)]|uniref:Uncharacterized protein n=1 Tax=Agrilutibacter terrestris TaxID=2865112 RepID=A0A7H0FVK2_9GAMM|nr:hypothetical protein [Lysobacter terrestris]QNP40068.1 hypothetical protein H8B22_11245 [Lysobacter terrestris]